MKKNNNKLNQHQNNLSKHNKNKQKKNNKQIINLIKTINNKKNNSRNKLY